MLWQIENQFSVKGKYSYHKLIYCLFFLSDEFSFRRMTFANSWSEIAHEVKISMTHFSWSIDSALYQDNFMVYLQDTLGF